MKKLISMDIREVSLCEFPANQRKFLIVKNVPGEEWDESEPDPRPLAVTEPTKPEPKPDAHPALPIKPEPSEPEPRTGPPESCLACKEERERQPLKADTLPIMKAFSEAVEKAGLRYRSYAEYRLDSLNYNRPPLEKVAVEKNHSELLFEAHQAQAARMGWDLTKFYKEFPERYGALRQVSYSRDYD